MKTTLISVLATLLSGYACSQPNGESRAEALAEDLLMKTGLPGLSITVSRGDSILWSRGFGFADVQQKRTVTSATRFRIGSLAKLFTAAVAARLAQDGLLDLDAPVQRYVPSFPDKGAPISTRQLLGHLSGIRQYGRSEYLNTHHYASVQEALGIFQNDSLLFTPGTKYHYSSYGYVLASAVIEKAAGSDFLRVLKDSLFEVLSLASITPDYNDTSDATQAKPYSLDAENRWVQGPFNDNSNRWGAGGLLSTAEDLARFGSLLLTDRFLSAGGRSLLFTSQKTADGKETGVGLGWRIAEDSAGAVYYHHGGDSVGGRAFLLIYPGSKVVVAILANLTFARFGEKQALELAKFFTP
jgi:serine beta-lactamase-like protein LACTB, mitochondrial